MKTRIKMTNGAFRRMLAIILAAVVINAFMTVAVSAVSDDASNTRTVMLEGVTVEIHDFVTSTVDISQALSRLPESVRKSFQNNGWKVEIYSLEEWKKIGLAENWWGCTSSQSKTVFLRTTSYQTLIHEFGHYVDMTLNGKGQYAGLCPGIEALRSSAEADSLSILVGRDYGMKTVNYCKTNSSEYFAESWFVYIVNPQELKQVAPGTYKKMRIQAILMALTVR